jgi:hypothetical protein
MGTSVITATSSGVCPCCCTKACFSKWQSIYTCASGTFGTPTLIDNECLPPASVSTAWTFGSGNATQCTYYLYVDAHHCCTTVGNCTTTAVPAAPTDHSACLCCDKVCYSQYTSNYTCSDGSWSTPAFVQNVCVTPGSVNTSWTYTSGDSTSCSYTIYVDTSHCCTTVGDCTQSAVPTAPTDHSACLCCSCRDTSLGGCTGCNDYPPSTITVSFTGGSMQTSCLDCPPNQSYKVTSGTLAGQTFTLTHGPACVWSYTNASGPITVTQYDDDTCTHAINTYNSINVILTLGTGRGLTVQIGGTFWVYQYSHTVVTPQDCCATWTAVDDDTGSSCFPSIILGWGSTAHVTPC